MSSTLHYIRSRHGIENAMVKTARKVKDKWHLYDVAGTEQAVVSQLYFAFHYMIEEVET